MHFRTEHFIKWICELLSITCIGNGSLCGLTEAAQMSLPYIASRHC